MARIDLVVNGENHQIDVDPQRGLLYVLRDELGLTGSKYGCGEGQCGACTVIIDGKATRSCITAVEAAAGKQITTIEGLEQNGKLHPVQEAFLEADAFQCGYCTPGMIVAGVALLKVNPDPSRQDVVTHMDGNVCRCGAYPRIIAAIRQASKEG